MYYSIKDFAELIGVSQNTLRLWDKSGKLKPHHKTNGGHRVYSEQQADEYFGVEQKKEIVLTFAGGMLDAEAYRTQSDFQKRQFEFSQKVADLQAKDAIKRGELQAKRVREAGKKIVGAQRAALAAQGIELDSGTALDIQEETAAFTEMDALTVKMNAYREAWGYKIESANYLAKSQYADIAGQFQA